MIFKRFPLAIFALITLLVSVIFQPVASQEQYSPSELQDPNFNWANLDVNKVNFNDPNTVNQIWDSWSSIPVFRQQELLRNPQMQERIRLNTGLASFSGCEASGASCSYDKITKSLTNGRITIPAEGLKNARVTALPEGGFKIEGSSTVTTFVGETKQEIKTQGTIDIKNDGSISAVTSESKITLKNGVQITGKVTIGRDGKITFGKDDVGRLDDNKNGIHIIASDTSVSFQEHLFNADKSAGKNAIYIDDNGNIFATGRSFKTAVDTTASPYTIYIGKDVSDYGFELEINQNSNGFGYNLGTIRELSEINEEGKVTTIFFDGQRYDIYSGYLMVHNTQTSYANVEPGYGPFEKLKETFGFSNKEILEARTQNVIQTLHPVISPKFCAPLPGEKCIKAAGGTYYFCNGATRMCDTSTGNWVE